MSVVSEGRGEFDVDLARNGVLSDEDKAEGMKHYRWVAAQVESAIQKTHPNYTFDVSFLGENDFGVDLLDGEDIFGLAPVVKSVESSTPLSREGTVEDSVMCNEKPLSFKTVESEHENIDEKQTITEDVDLDASVDEVVQDITRQSSDGNSIKSETAQVRTQLEEWLGVNAQKSSEEPEAVDPSQPKSHLTRTPAMALSVETPPISLTSPSQEVPLANEPSVRAADDDNSRNTESYKTEEKDRPPQTGIGSESSIRADMLEQLHAEEKWLENAIWQRLHILRDDSAASVSN